MVLKSIGIVGCGAIGKALINAVASGKLSVRIAGITSRTEKSGSEVRRLACVIAISPNARFRPAA